MRPLPTWGADAHLAWSKYSVVSLNCREGSPGLIGIGRRMHAICPERKLEPDTKPTVSLDVVSFVASSGGYYRGQIGQRAAQSFTVHVATQSGLAKRRQHRHLPRVQPVAPMRERHCRRPRSCTDQAPYRDQGHPGGAHGRRNNPIASPCHGMRCPPVYPLSPPGNGLSTLDARWKPFNWLRVLSIDLTS